LIGTGANAPCAAAAQEARACGERSAILLQGARRRPLLFAGFFASAGDCETTSPYDPST